VKAELLELAEKRIEEALRYGEKAERPTLSEIEGVVLRIRDELSVKLAEAVLNEQAKGKMVPGPRCPACGKEMGYKESHGLDVTSWVGDLRIERGYYHCAGCQRGLFPPRRATQAI
jgi:C4-type Zn-finger protein